MKTTTLNRIREHSPYASLWEKLLKGLGKTQADDEPLAFSTILEICGLDDALWATRAEPQYNWLPLAVSYGRRVQHLNPDPRVSDCLDVAERYANGLATDDELAEAWDAARDAWGALCAGPAALVAWGARDAALGNLFAAAKNAAQAAALVARDAAWEAARGNVLDVAQAAEKAAWDAERKEQEKLFLDFVSQ